MTFWYGKPTQEDQTLPGAGGEAELGAIAEAAYRSAKYVDSMLASELAQEEATDRRNKAIFAETGVKLGNPFRGDARGRADGTTSFSGAQSVRIKKYEQRLQQLAEQHPEARDAIRAGTGVLAMGEELTRESDKNLSIQMNSRDGMGKWAAVFAGSAAAIRHDPLQIASLGLGAELSAARTMFGAIAKTAMKEALINGASEAALQPFVQNWREQAGLDHGFDVAMSNVLMAAGIGGAFGGLAAVPQAAMRPRLSGPTLDAAVQSALPKLKPEARAALENGSVPELRTALDPIRPALPPEARGALDAADVDAHSLAAKPERTDPRNHAQAIALAERQVLSREPMAGVPTMPVDMDRVNRLAALEVLPAPRKSAADKALADAAPAQKGRVLTVSEFVMARGGMRDRTGDAASQDMGLVAKSGLGRMMREDGLDIDDMRSIAAQAGYFPHYGTVEEAVARSTPDELLDLIARDMGGVPQYSVFDLAEGRVQDGDVLTLKEARADAARYMEEVLAYGGPGMDDELVSLAARKLASGMDVDSAIERAAIELGDIKGPRPDLRAATREDFPGFEPVADGIDDVPALLREAPDATDAELEALAGEIPDFDMDGYSIRDMMDMADKDDEMAFLLENCRLR